MPCKTRSVFTRNVFLQYFHNLYIFTHQFTQTRLQFMQMLFRGDTESISFSSKSIFQRYFKKNASRFYCNLKERKQVCSRFSGSQFSVAFLQLEPPVVSRRRGVAQQIEVEIRWILDRNRQSESTCMLPNQIVAPRSHSRACSHWYNGCVCKLVAEPSPTLA